LSRAIKLVRGQLSPSSPATSIGTSSTNKSPSPPPSRPVCPHGLHSRGRSPFSSKVPDNYARGQGWGGSLF
jgi:hypothetical protein